MRKGTTPTFVFTLPFSTDLVAKARVIFKLGDEVKVKKTVDSSAFEGDKIKVRLTQEETFAFQDNSYFKVQLRIVTRKEEALASDVYEAFADECLDDEVL